MRVSKNQRLQTVSENRTGRSHAKTTKYVGQVCRKPEGAGLHRGGGRWQKGQLGRP